MDAGDVITLVGVVVAVGAAAVAIWQAKVAQGSATSARDSADAAIEQARLAREQQTADRVHRARVVHDAAHDALAAAVHELDPDPVRLAGNLRSRHVVTNAAPHLDDVERHARRLTDVGAAPVADAYMAARGTALRVGEFVKENLTLNGIGTTTAEVPRFADGFESLMRQLNRDRESAEQRWTDWRRDQETSE
ncbi:hypothetical protein [Pseudonocardia alni]|uniref:hypothetical protein n=1 Tax=Pseudonocardia alni TaxID=33907 RepID=UPI00331DDF3D